MPIIVAFLNLAKAFDTLNYKILLKKLDRYGIRGNSLKLLTRYHSDRLHNIKFQEYISLYNLITTGDPQGTIIGPLLSDSDQLDDMPKEIIMSYADNTVVISRKNTWTSAQDKMNK